MEGNSRGSNTHSTLEGITHPLYTRGDRTPALHSRGSHTHSTLEGITHPLYNRCTLLEQRTLLLHQLLKISKIGWRFCMHRSVFGAMKVCRFWVARKKSQAAMQGAQKQSEHKIKEKATSTQRVGQFVVGNAGLMLHNDGGVEIQHVLVYFVHKTWFWIEALYWDRMYRLRVCCMVSCCLLLCSTI